MGIVMFVVIGLVVGAIAKFLMQGSQSEPSGFFGTLLLGIVGAVVGGWVWSLLFRGTSPMGIDAGSLIVAVLGACLTIGALRLIRR